jgi:hypothetical protein
MRPKRKNVCQVCRSRKLAVSSPYKRTYQLTNRLFKCDGKEPACFQCTLRGIQCSGYRQEFVFVSQISSKTDNQAELNSGNKKILGYQKKAPDNSDDDHIRSTKCSQLASLDGMSAQSQTKRFYKLEDDIQFIMQYYGPNNNSAPGESNPFQNQICGAWVEALPLLSVTKRNKQFLLSAIRTMATALRYYNLGDELSQPQIVEMYCDSLGHMGKALEEARGAFQIEHSAAIMCLAATDVSDRLEQSYCLTHD